MQQFSKRQLFQISGATAALAALGLSPAALAQGAADNWAVPADLQKRMYDTALAIARADPRAGVGRIEAWERLQWADARNSSP